MEGGGDWVIKILSAPPHPPTVHFNSKSTMAGRINHWELVM